MRQIKMREGLKKIDGVTVNDNEGGTRFYFKHMSPKAREGKKKNRKASRRSRRANR